MSIFCTISAEISFHLFVNMYELCNYKRHFWQCFICRPLGPKMVNIVDIRRLNKIYNLTKKQRIIVCCLFLHFYLHFYLRLWYFYIPSGNCSSADLCTVDVTRRYSLSVFTLEQFLIRSIIVFIDKWDKKYRHSVYCISIYDGTCITSI